MASLIELERESIQLIQAHVKDGCHVSFSGGKDSLVVLELVRRSGVPYDVFYCNTGIDHPETIKYIRSIPEKVKFLRPRTLFFHDVKRWGPPGQRWRWCCLTLKERPARRLGGLQVLGIRSEESLRRKNREVLDKYNCLHPILTWNEAEVWEYIDSAGLEYNPLYEKDGISRIGCIPCPYAASKELILRLEQHPKLFQVYLAAINHWFLHSVNPNVLKFGTTQGFIEHWFRGELGKALADKVPQNAY